MKVVFMVSIAQVFGKVSDRKSVQRVLSKESPPSETTTGPGTNKETTAAKAAAVPVTNAKTAAAAATPTTNSTDKSSPNAAQYNLVSYLADMGYIGKNNGTFKLAKNKTCSKSWRTATLLQAFLGL